MAIVATTKHRLAGPKMWSDFGPALDRMNAALAASLSIATVDDVQFWQDLDQPTGVTIAQDLTTEFGSPAGASVDGRIVVYQPQPAATDNVQLPGVYEIQVHVTLSDGQPWVGRQTLTVVA